MSNIYDYDKMKANEGKICQFCHTKRRLVVRQDFRSEKAKLEFPLSEQELTILDCLCLHPGDLVIGGFF